MNLRSRLATTVGKFTHWFLSTFTGGGSSLPGKIATAIDPQLLNHLAQDYQIIVVTGTNGKTLTTALTTRVIQAAYQNVLTNETGSNMIQGVVGTFLMAPYHTGQKFAVIEVDEGSLKHVLTALDPLAIVHTNIFPDQMDRFANLQIVQDLLFEGAQSVPQATVIYNADDPYLNPEPLSNPTRSFGVTDARYQATDPFPEDLELCEGQLQYHSRIFADLGNYYCPKSDFQRPGIQDQVTHIQNLSNTGSIFEINGQVVQLPIAGIYNIYNALAAYSVGKFLNIDEGRIRTALATAQQVDGRQESFFIQGKEVTLNLVKNPVGLNQVLDLLQLESTPYDFYFFLNDQYADGEDTTWIQSAHFKTLLDTPHPPKQVFAGGKRSELVKEELLHQGFTEPIQRVTAMEDLLELIQTSPQTKIHLLATYTAMVQIRDYLKQQT